MQKSDIKRIVGFLAAVAVMFFLAPAILNRMPELVRVNGTMILVMSLNHVLMIVVGWQSNHLSKYNFYPVVIVVLIYAASELLFYRSISWELEINYLESGYLAYFLKKFLMRRQKQLEQQQKQKPFPKGVKRK